MTLSGSLPKNIIKNVGLGGAVAGDRKWQIKLPGGLIIQGGGITANVTTANQVFSTIVTPMTAFPNGILGGFSQPLTSSPQGKFASLAVEYTNPAQATMYYTANTTGQFGISYMFVGH